MSGESDPDRQTKRAGFTIVGGILAVTGVICLIRGILLFTTPMRRPTQEFFDNPVKTMDANKRSASRGMGFFMAGGVMMVIGLGMVAAGTRRPLGPVHTDEMMPMGSDPAEDIARMLSSAVLAAREKARQESQAVEPAGPGIQHTCGAWNEIDDRFCKGCGQPLVRLYCPRCGVENDPDAKFCDKCGAPMGR